MFKKNIKINNLRGFSLVETLVAIAIMSLLVLTTISLLTNTSKSEKRNRVITEVEYQASAIIYDIAQAVRNASAFTSPAVLATSTSLTLAMSSIPAEDPTVFSFSSPTVTVSRALGEAIQLSSNTVEITDLNFQNITAPDTKGAVRISLSVKGANPNNKPELEYSTVRITTVTLR